MWEEAQNDTLAKSQSTVRGLVVVYRLQLDVMDFLTEL